MSMIDSRATAAIAAALWAQQASVGVQAATLPSRGLIDPEVLLIESAIIGEVAGEVRILDGAVAWGIAHHDLISTARLKVLLRRYEPAQQDAFRLYARRVVDQVGRLAWPAVARADRWQPSTSVQLPSLTASSSVGRLRVRALFGSNARAEAIARLASAHAPLDLATLERDTLYSKRHLALPLEQLASEGSVERTWIGNRQLFRLSPSLRAFLGAGDPEPWVDWHQRFTLARTCGAALSELTGPTGPVLALARIRSHEIGFSVLGIPVPAPMRIEDDPEARRGELVQWLQAAIDQLVMVSLAAPRS